MRKFIHQLISAGHHGKGLKYTRKGDFEKALKHFRTALEYALRSDNKGSIPHEMECIARTFVRLKDYEQAQKYATESLSLYKEMQWAGSIFEKCVERVETLLETIEKRGPI